MKVYALISIFLWGLTALAQRPPEPEVRVEAGVKNLTVDQPFILSVIVRNHVNRPTVTFPDFVGLEKRSASATSTTSSVGGKTVIIQTITQQYFAQREGELILPEFTVIVDGNKIKTEALTLTFQKGKEEAKPTLVNSNISEEELEDLNQPDTEDVFLSVKTSQSSVYLKEGFSLRLALYVAKNAPIDMEFYQLGFQLQEILKKLRPATCWEENVGIEEIIQKEVEIRGRRYTEYQMYQAMLFPFTVQHVAFPAVSLKMLVTETKTGEGKKKGLRTFYSAPTRVLVKPLPPHPQKDQVAVGEYNLHETLTKTRLASGESLRYLFTVSGRGNLATVMPPEVPKVQAFDFYPPDMNQTVQRSYAQVSGEKTFDYFIVAKQNGTYPLGRFFQWIFFNPSTARYDTLQSTKTITVAGENIQNASVMDSDTRFIYENIEQLDTTETYVDYQNIIRNLTNVVVLVLMGIMGWIIRK